MFYFCIPPGAIYGANGLTYASSGIFTAVNNPIHPTRRLTSAVLLIGYKGTYPITQDGRAYVLSENTYMLLFPGHTHGGNVPASEGQSHFWCHFLISEDAGAYVTDTPPDIHIRQGSGICVLPEFGFITHAEKFRILSRQLIDASENDYPDPAARGAICSAYISILLQELSQAHLALVRMEALKLKNGTSAKQAALVSDIREYLRTAICDESLTVASIAERFNYNAHYLTRVFHGETGMSLIHYIGVRRMDEAKKLLLNSSLPLEKIALAVGYSDSKYFMKAFKKHCHVTPSEYRRSFYRQHINKQ